jgi:hypothetical protein
VFERFYTGFKGHTGLGLTITQIDCGTPWRNIRVGTNEAHGARFLMTFPRKVQEIPAKERRMIDHVSEDFGIDRGGGILTVGILITLRARQVIQAIQKRKFQTTRNATPGNRDGFGCWDC